MLVSTTVGAGSAVVSRWVSGLAGVTYARAIDEHEALVERYESAKVEAEQCRRRAIDEIRTTYDHRGDLERALVIDVRSAMLRDATRELEAEVRRSAKTADAAAGHVLRAYKRAALAEAATLQRRLGVA